jgi:ATP-dependent DNA ligase
MGLEGIISKEANGTYRSGPCKTWVKVKNKKAPGWLRVRDGMEG